MTRSELKQLVREVRDLYAEADAVQPLRDCRGRTSCCRFKLAGHVPYITRAEAWVAATGVRASGRQNIGEPAAQDGACPCLGSDGCCTIYEYRPLGCRTHFCAAAGGPVPRKLVREMIRRLEELDVELGGDGARQLPVALAETLTNYPRR